MVNLFFDSEDKKEYRYRVLVYPNITYPDNLEKDSYVVVLRNAIRVLNTIRNDIFYTLLTPSFVKSLAFPNTEQIIYPLPVFPNAMRAHFDFFSIKKILSSRRNDYDIVYSHLPEHTLQLVNYFENSTNISPRIIGYCHWFELPENVGFKKRFFEQNILGLLEMEECGVNSVWLKNLVIKKAAEFFNNKVLEKLDKIIQPHYLGIDMIDFSKTKKRERSILFNHRDGVYTGWDDFIRMMDSLWEKRKDFKVYTTLAYKDRPYVEKVSIGDRTEYLKFVKSMSVGVGYFKKYSAWSIATTDGLCLGVPYILPDSLCYPEMVGKDYPLLFKTLNEKSFLEKLNNILDDKELQKKCVSYLEPRMNDMLWENTVKEWFSGWKSVFDDDSFYCISDSTAYKDILKYIREKKIVTKKDLIVYLGWGVNIPFSPYRNRLRKEKDIYFTKDSYCVRV